MEHFQFGLERGNWANALQALIDRELVYISEHTAEKGKPVYAPYNPFMAAWFKYR